MPLQFISKPSSAIQGDFIVPGDKSISHRSLILGSIAQGTTTIRGFLPSSDCQATATALESMGVRIERFQEDQILIHGVGKYGLIAPKNPINCGNSGTSMRLLSGLLSAQPFSSSLYGDNSLNKRPMDRVINPLNLMGAGIIEGKAPIFIPGGKTLKGIEYKMPIASAQVKSALLLSGIYAQGSTVIIEPEPTRDHTEKMLETFSYPIKKIGPKITIQSHSNCLGCDIAIPGDISSAAFFIVAASLIPGSKLLIKNVGVNPTRTGLIEILKQMGAKISINNLRNYGLEPVADLQIEYSPLKGMVIPAAWVPNAIDEFPIIFIAAACAEGETILSGAAELRYKETDRLAVMIAGLKRLGIQAQDYQDDLRIIGGAIQGGEVDSHQDHRIAMAFAVAGFIAKETVIIKNCDQVATSFPNFIQSAKSLKLNIEEIEHEI
jgi:3-phosphoshikimate 1-carboxyvinyltransferase